MSEELGSKEASSCGLWQEELYWALQQPQSSAHPNPHFPPKIWSPVLEIWAEVSTQVSDSSVQIIHSQLTSLWKSHQQLSLKGIFSPCISLYRTKLQAPFSKALFDTSSRCCEVFTRGKAGILIISCLWWGSWTTPVGRRFLALWMTPCGLSFTSWD